jgi:Holliday junction resolvase RusA-like endonuclease
MKGAIMTESIEFFVPGIPKAQARTGKGFNAKTGASWRYDPKTSAEWKAQVAWIARQNYAGDLLGGPLVMLLVFVLPRPKSLPKKIREHVRKPDLSNLLKAVEDALKGVLYHDDSQLVDINISKEYGSPPGVRITVQKPVELAVIEPDPGTQNCLLFIDEAKRAFESGALEEFPKLAEKEAP